MNQPTTEELFAAAKKNFDEDRFAKACNLYEQVVERDPSHAEAYYSLGLAFAKRGRHGQAVEQYKKAIEQGFDKPEVHHAKGRSLAGLEKYDEAIAEYAQATQASPTLAEAYDDAGQAYLRKGDFDAAVTQFADAVSADRRLIASYLHWAEAYEGRGDYNAAFDRLCEAFELEPANDEVNEGLRRVLRRLEPQDDALQRLQQVVSQLGAAAYFEWGQTLVELGKAEQAISQFLEAIKAEAASGYSVSQMVFMALAEAVKQLSQLSAPQSQSALAQVRHLLDEVKLPSAYLYWAEELFENGLLNEARNYLWIAFKSAPAGVANHRLLRLILASDAIESEARDRAIAELQEIIDSSDDAMTRSRWGVTLCEMGRYEQGVTQFERAIAQAELPEAHAAWGDALIAQGQFDQAISHLLDAIHLGLKLGIRDWVMEGWWSRLFKAVRGLKTPSREIIDKIQNTVGQTGAAATLVKWGRTLGEIGQTDLEINQLELALDRDLGFEDAHLRLRELKENLTRKPELIARLDAKMRESKNPLARLEWGKTVTELQGPQAAIEHFEQAASLDPDNADAHREAGNAYAKCDKFAQAIERYLRAIEADPELDEVYMDWAEALSKLETREGLVAKLVQALSKLETREGLVAKLVQSLTARDGYGLAVINWDEIQAASAKHAERAERLCREIERNLDDADAYINLGVEMEKQGRSEESFRLFRRAVELDSESSLALCNCGIELANLSRHDEAIEKYQAALKLKPDYFDAYCGQARSFIELQQYDNAIKRFEEAFEKGTDLAFSSDDEKRSKQIEAYNDWAFALSESREYDLSLKVSQQAMQLKPDEFSTHFRMAYVYFDMMRYDQALAKYEEATRISSRDKKAGRISSQNPYAWHNIADLFEQRGEYRRAREKWVECVRLYQQGLAEALGKRDTNYCLYYGLALKEALHDLGGAEALFRAARALNPADPRIHARLASLYLEYKTSADRSKNKNARPDGADAKTFAQWRAFESYQAAEQILRRRPGDSGAWVELGELHLLMERDDKAEDAFMKSLAKNENSARIHKGLGELYLRTNRYDGAIRHLRASLLISPDDLSAQAKLAQAHFKSGALDEAEVEYQRVLSVTGFHVHSLIGLAEVYLDMADKLSGGREAPGREHLYARAIDQFSKAIQVAKSENCPSSFNGNLSSVYYLRGYAKIQLYEASRLTRETGLVREALRDFDKCQPTDADYHKAQRAIARIRDEALRTSPRSLLERSVPGVISALSIMVFLLAQLGFFYGLPVRGERFELTEQSLAAFAAAGIGAEAVEKLKQIENLPFQNREELLTRAKSLLGENGLAAAKNAILRHAARTRGGWELERIEVGYYSLLTFGALLFMIAGAYLPQLTSLKLPGLQLDKSTVERVETVRSIGVSK